MRKVKIIKIKDDKYKGNHPNGINVGYTKVGFEVAPPQIGVRYAILPENHLKMDNVMNDFSTSIVLSLPDKEGIFRTLYSTYKLEYIDE
jgi:hypothetical protein